mgnify:FL=1
MELELETAAAQQTAAAEPTIIDLFKNEGCTRTIIHFLITLFLITLGKFVASTLKYLCAIKKNRKITK